MLGHSINTSSTIDIQDILYGGVAGEMPLPEILPEPDSQDLHLSDSKQAQSSDIVENPEMYCYAEAISAAASSQDIDRRPRVFDKISKEFGRHRQSMLCDQTLQV